MNWAFVTTVSRVKHDVLKSLSVNVQKCGNILMYLILFLEKVVRVRGFAKWFVW